MATPDDVITTISNRRCTIRPIAALEFNTILSTPSNTIETEDAAVATPSGLGAGAGAGVIESESIVETQAPVIPASTTTSPLRSTTPSFPTLATPTTGGPEAAIPPVRVAPVASSLSPVSPPPQTEVPSGVGTSQADNNIAASVSDGSSVATTLTTASITSLPDPPEGILETSASLISTSRVVETPPTENNAVPTQVADSGPANQATMRPVPNPNSNAVQSTVAVAGGVIGGVVALSLLAFVIWWWRRRRVKKRRSTLLTPLDAVPSFDRDEKGPYVINRGSIGPTPVTEKFKAAVGYNVKRFRGRVRQLSKAGNKAPSVNLDRGTSQFMDGTTQHSRENSASLVAQVTAKDRFVDWWGRMTADMSFNWRVRNSRNDMASLGSRGVFPTGTITPGVGEPSEKTNSGGSLGSQPDFLTLLGMDDNELDREAQRRRASLSRKNGSVDNFLLGLSFGGSNQIGDNPFSDANATAHTSAKPAPLAVGGGGGQNPFSDANALPDNGGGNPQMPKPANAAGGSNGYVAEIRRSRGQSVSGARERQNSGMLSSYYGGLGPGRESLVSDVGSYAVSPSVSTRNNKFRSDPFDLERPELLGGGGRVSTTNTAVRPGSSRVSGGVGTGSVRRPPPTAAGGVQIRTSHARHESFTSKYSSGISLGDWSDPGPDVGPAAAVTSGGGGGTGGTGREVRESPTRGWRDRLEREKEAATAASGSGVRRQSKGSQRSVGKAM